MTMPGSYSEARPSIIKNSVLLQPIAATADSRLESSEMKRAKSGDTDNNKRHSTDSSP